MPLTEEQKALVKASVPALQARGFDITRLFYERLLAENPALNGVFNNANQTKLDQPRALAGSVLAYAANIDNLGALGPAVELIANKHASLYVRPEQYAVVAKYLLQAIVDVLGDAVTPELGAAWEAAYWQLADVLIKREDDLYKAADGWTDWAEFRIKKKVKESEEITSFYLEPVDERSKPLPPFLPGQYISIQLEVPQLGHLQARQYSLSDAPCPDYYRVSIKREGGVDGTDRVGAAPPGLISNLMHDHKGEGDVVRVSHPMGDFFLDPAAAAAGQRDAPLVLVSAGVGLTCLTAILNALVARHSSRPISWVHVARSTGVRAFAQHVADVARARPNVRLALFNPRPAEADVKGVDYHHEGKLDLAKLDRETELFVSDPRAQYYVCGPAPFMLDVERGLTGYGVDSARIHMELFGTGGPPRA